MFNICILAVIKYFYLIFAVAVVMYRVVAYLWHSEIQLRVISLFSLLPSLSILFTSVYINCLCQTTYLNLNCADTRDICKYFLTCHQASCQFVPSEFMHRLKFQMLFSTQARHMLILQDTHEDIIIFTT